MENVVMTGAITGDPMSMLANMGIVSIILFIVFLALFLKVWWNIFKKAGYSGWLGILMILPIVNLVLLLVLAFAEWPILKGQSTSMPQAPAEGE